MAETKAKATLEIGGSVSNSLGRAFYAVTRNTGKLGASLKGLKSQAADLRKELAKGVGGPEAERNLAKLESQIKSTERSMKVLGALKSAGLGSKLSSFGSNMVRGFGLVTAGALAAGATVYKLTASVGEYADNAAEAASALGMQTNALIAMKYAADDVGTGAETLSTSLAKMQANLEKARKKGGGNVFKLLHLDARKLSRQKPEQQIESLSEAFKAYNGKVSKTAIAMALFGKSGAKMVNFLNLGKEGLAGYADEAKQVGLTLTDDLIKAGDEFGRQQLRLQATLTGTRNIIGAQLLPVVNELLNEFSVFLRESGPDLGAWAKQFAETLRRNGPSIQEFAEDILELGKSTKNFIESIGGAKTALIGLVTLAFLPAISSGVTLGVTVAKLAHALITLETAGWAAYAPLAKIAAISGAISWIFGTQLNSIGTNLQDAKRQDILSGATPATPQQKAAARSGLGASLKERNSENIATQFVNGSFGLNLLDWLNKKLWGSESALGPANKAKQLNAAPASEIPQYLRRRGATNDNRTINNNITINAAPGMDAKALADLVMSRLDGRQAALAGGALYD